MAQDKYLEKLENENEILKSLVKEKSTEADELQKEKAENDEAIVELKKEVDELKKEVAEKDAVLKEIGDSLAVSEDQVEKLEEELDEKKAELEEFKKLGETPEEIKEVLENVNESLLGLIEVGGSKEEIIAKLEGIKAVEDELTQYKSIGTIDEIVAFIQELKDIKFDASAEKLASEVGIEKEAAKIALEKTESYDAAKSFISKIVGNKSTASARKVEKHESVKVVAGTVDVDKLSALKSAIRSM